MEQPEKKETNHVEVAAKAVVIGVGTAIVATSCVLAYGVSKALNNPIELNGAAFFSKAMSEMGGGSKESGGNGMIGGLTNILTAAFGGAIIGATAVVVEEVFNN
jgi:hypothetical protein